MIKLRRYTIMTAQDVHKIKPWPALLVTSRVQGCLLSMCRQHRQELCWRRIEMNHLPAFIISLRNPNLTAAMAAAPPSMMCSLQMTSTNHEMAIEQCGRLLSLHSLQTHMQHDGAKCYSWDLCLDSESIPIKVSILLPHNFALVSSSTFLAESISWPSN